MTTVKCRCGMALSYVCDGDTGDLLDWRHSYLIPLYCNLYVANNFQLMKFHEDMKLRVLIKEVLVVFHWLPFRIIYIYIYIYIAFVSLSKASETFWPRHSQNFVGGLYVVWKNSYNLASSSYGYSNFPLIYISSQL